MSLKKIINICIIIEICIILLFYNTNVVKARTNLIQTSIEQSKDVYDVILFFGQSNMSGSMTVGIDARYNLENANSVREYSSKTKIDQDIINGTWVSNYTVTDVKPNTVYEYHVLDNSLYDLSDLEINGYSANGAEITVNKYNGELLYFDQNTNRFYGRWSTGRPSYIKENCYTFSNAYGTNMVNEFAKVYYERTGHKVVCVLAALGGQSLEHFTPNSTFYDNGTAINLYAAMKAKYTAAIRYLESNNLNIGNRSFVMFQGENEVGYNNSSIISAYKENFKKIKTQLLKDCGINKGAIVLSGFYPGLYNGVSYAKGVKYVNQAQREIINENSDVVLGSDFPYKHYVPSETDYNNTTLYDYKTNMGGVDYNTALSNAKLVTGGYNDDNMMHFTSAALAQIGRQTANNLCNSLKKTLSTLNVTLSQNSYIYDGREKTPTVTVRDGNTTLVLNTDYTVSYSNNVNSGTAKVIITGRGIYTGTKEITFEITKENIEIVAQGYNGVYDGNSHGINVEVKKPVAGALIRYGKSDGVYNLNTAPTYKDCRNVYCILPNNC